MSTRKPPKHSRQCKAYGAAIKRRSRHKSLPGDDAVIAHGRQCSASHRGTVRESAPREATMSAPVAPPAEKPAKSPKVSTRKSVDKPAPATPPPPPAEHHGGRAAMVLLIWLAAATFNAAIMSLPLNGMAAPFTGLEAACAMVMMEAFLGMLLMDSVGLTHMIQLLANAHWGWRTFTAVVSLALMVGLIGLEVALGDMRDVTHQVGLLTAKAMAGSSEDAGAQAAVGDIDSLMRAHAWISLWMQRGFGVILPLITMFAVMPLETLLQSLKRRPKPVPAPIPAAGPRTEEEPIGDKVARFPLGSSRA